MKCITKRHYHSRGQCNGSELYGKHRNGNEYPLFGEFEALHMIVSDGKYRIESDNGEVFRQGLCDGSNESIFEIYDSTELPTGYLQLETPDYSGTFEDFELVHGHDRVERTEKRKFYAYTETTENETAFGITETMNGYTQAIHSVYIPEEMSRREKARYIVKYLYDILKANEYASVSYSGLNFDNVNIYEYGVDSFRCYPMTKDADKLEQAHLLYLGALERKGSVVETFETGVKYVVQGLFKEDEEEGREE